MDTNTIRGKVFVPESNTTNFQTKKILSEFLNHNESMIQSVIYFVGDSEFKTQLPANVINSRLGRYIKNL
jgi:hypothetical protein